MAVSSQYLIASEVVGAFAACMRGQNERDPVGTRNITRPMDQVVGDEETRFRLTIPAADAFSFAMGWTDLGYPSASDSMRHVVGLLVVDTLEYAEEWRAAARARACLAERWPACDCF